MAGTKEVRQVPEARQEEELTPPRRERSELRRPPRLALDAAAKAHRSKLNEKMSAPVRFEFIDAGNRSVPPPMTQMLRGGRSGVVRLKLYLSLLWFGNPKNELTYPALRWATLLGLDHPEVNGARRVSQAFQWLEQRKFITMQSRQGHPPRVRVLEEDGNGAAYGFPWVARKELKRETPGGRVGGAHLYVRLPSTFWTNGWIAVLSGSAVAMLLAILRLAGKNQAKTVWVSPSEAAIRFGLSEDTRTAGVRELASYGLLSIKRRSVSRDDSDWDFRRVRNAYQLSIAAFEYEPGEVPNYKAPSDAGAK